MTPERRIGENIIIPPEGAEATPDTPPINPATPALGGIAGRLQARRDRKDAVREDDAAFLSHVADVNLRSLESPTTVDAPHIPIAASAKSHAGAPAAKKLANWRERDAAFTAFKAANPGLSGHELMVSFREQEDEMRQAEQERAEAEKPVIDTPRTFMQEQRAINANRSRDRVKIHRLKQMNKEDLYDEVTGTGVIHDSRAVKAFTEEERMMPGAKRDIKKANRWIRFIEWRNSRRMGALRNRRDK